MPEKLWESYANALIEVAPSKILGNLLRVNELPPAWRRLSSYPLPANRGFNNVDFVDFRFILKHPISAEEKPLENLTRFWNTTDRETKERFLKALEGAERKVAEELRSANSMEKFAKLWDNLVKRLQQEYENALYENNFNPTIAEELVHLPADPLVPDHDWLSRLDIYASLKSGEFKLLRFKLSPIQGFIGNARTERDLWAGSHMLSLLTYLAISVIWRKFGPNAIIFPHLRGQPFFEHELGTLNYEKRLLIGNMPNKVLVMVPGDTDVKKLEEEIENEIRGFLERLAKAAWEFYEVTEHLKVKRKNEEQSQPEKKEKFEDYKDSVRGYFSITVESIPVTSLNLNEIISDVLRKYLGAIPDGTESPIHSYSELFLLLDQATDFKSRDYVRPGEDGGFKCMLCGEHLAIGGNSPYPDVREKWANFVEYLHNNGIYDVKKGERLCLLCLAKRFYHRFYALWKEDYWIVHKSGEEIGKLVKDHFEGKYLDRMSFRSVSEVAIAKPTEKAIELKETNKLYITDPDGKSRPVSWADVYDEVLAELGIEGGKRHSFGGVKSPDIRALIDKLATALLIPFGRLAPNSEVFYIENLRDLKSLAKAYGTDENDSRLRGVSVDAIRSLVEELSKIIGEPPKYYAILKMDGDNMGKVISGTEAVKTLEEYAHSSVSNAVPRINRPVTPTVHIGITRSLSNFAVNAVPLLSDSHGAELLYAGGDDVFALVPANEAVSLVFELQKTFREDWEEFEPLQGKTRSMSAGLLFLYYKEPLYSAVRRVNEMEHLAKESGRNALAVGYLKHSGSYYRVSLNWGVFGKPLQNLLEELGNEEGGLSNRIIYEIAEGIEVWPNEPKAIINLLKYEMGRHSNYEKDEKSQQRVFKRLAEFLWVARNVRVKLSKEDLERSGFRGDKTLRDLVNRFNELIQSVVVDDPEREGVSDEYQEVENGLNELFKGRESSLWIFKLEEKLTAAAPSGKAPGIAGIVLRKQLRGAAHLLKILKEMGVGL
ncbi:type III-B CRISPR-associated protein Cas10/Cmr2 [Thermococcus sp. Bubb.Bath]|uniref:type III-B CRISPR-associated protein Cas10/Cmr2 n=1 Tax=Thermococcus sp. Bubb.Bath TaxID=1638242 RepID=UPI0014394E72|nr:type III-B CRISPR-associated protein Cas10/Cmr2 [Thermococcus sp. Bubb.Bath]